MSENGNEIAEEEQRQKAFTLYVPTVAYFGELGLSWDKAIRQFNTWGELYANFLGQKPESKQQIDLMFKDERMKGHIAGIREVFGLPPLTSGSEPWL